MKVGFIVWNPFQLIQFESVALLIEKPTVFIIDKGNNLKLFSKNHLRSNIWKIEVIKPNEIPIIDGIYDILLFQSPFPNIEKLKQSKLVSMQYGLAKERHNYGEWRSLADMNLMYGNYSSEKVSHYSPAYPVGNPKFDNWELYKKYALNKSKLYKELNLNLDKKTILYMPTWGDLGSFDELLDEISDLQSEYNIILKMHHNNDAKSPEWIKSAKEASLKHIYDGSADQLKLISASDLIISDFSGAIFDGLYAGKPILLFQSGVENKVGLQKFDFDSLEFSRRDEIGHVCMNIADFKCAVAYCLSNPDKIVDNYNKIRSELFYSERNLNASQLCVDYINKLHNNSIPELTLPQQYVRQTVKSLRSLNDKINRLEKKTYNKQSIFNKITNHFLKKNDI